jgi:hypothetical protein
VIDVPRVVTAGCCEQTNENRVPKGVFGRDMPQVVMYTGIKAANISESRSLEHVNCPTPRPLMRTGLAVPNCQIIPAADIASDIRRIFANWQRGITLAKDATLAESTDRLLP